MKNTKYRLGTKVLAVIILWVSLLVSFGSGIFLLLNTDAIRLKHYEGTYDYTQAISRLVHNTVELGAKFKHGNQDFTDLSRFKDIKYNLSYATNFNYHMKDVKTGKTSSQGDYSLEEIKAHPSHIYISKDDIPQNLYMSTDLDWMLENSPQELYILLNDPLVPGDVFYDTYTQFTMAKARMPYAIAGLGGGVLLIFISLGYLVIVSGRKEKGGEVELASIDRIYNDIQSIFVAGAAIISISLVSAFSFGYGGYNPDLIILMIIFAIDLAIGMTYLFSMLRQFKKGVLLKNTLMYKFFSSGIKFVKGIFTEKIFKGWIIGAMFIYTFVNVMLVYFIESNYRRFMPGVFLFVVFNLLVAYLVFKRLKSLTVIMNAAKEISSGNLDYQIDKSQISIEFENFGQDIQSIQGGLKNAVNNAIKGERMKTDLITNVSHDLKTPLTSIINYVDLLKQEEINNETATGYLEILDEKSYRLKQLIEDLIEASKASSGNLSITKEEVDLHELVIQACGEYEEKIEMAGLDIRIKAPEEKIVILADGKYMWRIIENIMSNALKYSMANSRIYIDVEGINGYGILTMKNMSAYPLDIDPSQLTERFIRADESRTTEGSGLGLSIAQSLTSIQDGKFHIEIDGDLFKVIVAMPIQKGVHEGMAQIQ